MIRLRFSSDGRFWKDFLSHFPAQITEKLSFSCMPWSSSKNSSLIILEQAKPKTVYPKHFQTNMCFQVKCKDCKKASWAVSLRLFVVACLFVIFERKGVSPHFPKQNYFPIVCYTRIDQTLANSHIFSPQYH